MISLSRRFMQGSWPARLLCAWLSIWPLAGQAVNVSGERPVTLKIGVLAHQGKQKAIDRWAATADYLSREIPRHRFELLPLGFEEIYQAVADGRVDFVVANSGMYVEFEALHGARRIATLENLRLGRPHTLFGGVIFRKAARGDIQTLADLRGQRFMAVDETSLGGWRMAWRELRAAGINPFHDFQSLEFSNVRHEDVVRAVRGGRVDAGTVRTGILERMARAGEIRLNEFQVIHHQDGGEDFPFLLSTRLYPEWPFAVLHHVSGELAKQVAIALMRMPADSPAARDAQSAGWTIPANYQSVHECFKELHLGPYRDLGRISLRRVLQTYLYPILATGLLILLLAAAMIYFQRREISQRTRVEIMLRRDEIRSREQARELERKVSERTRELAGANLEITKLNERLRAENLRMSSELEVTRRLQQLVLPNAEELRHIRELDVAGFMEPADEVGGDYYDVLQHDGQVKISIGDVTGHGLESGMLMLMVQTAVRTLLANGVSDARTFLSILNQTIYSNVKRMNSDKNLTLSLLDYHDGLVRLSGQHEEVLVIRKDCRVERIDTIDLGFMIGLEEDISPFVNQHEINLQAGDGIVLYTDGITEARGADNHMYGVENLCHVLCANWRRDAESILQAVITDLRRHIGERKINDDITLVVIKQKHGQRQNSSLQGEG